MPNIFTLMLEICGALVFGGLALILLYALGCVAIIGWKKLREVWKQ